MRAVSTHRRAVGVRGNGHLSGKVVVITGASSGIGRAAALEFAREGARLVLAARRVDALEQVSDECRAAGSEAVVVRTDVTAPDQVDHLARAAVERFGRFDIWVNNAAVLAMGRFDDVPPNAFRAVIETNLFGRVYGTRVALRHFRAHHRGIVIDVNSVLGLVAQPYASAYIASKFAVRGLLQSLRTELIGDPHIHLCSVLPAPIDTPIYENAANFTGREIRAMWPVYDPKVVARAIVRQAIRPRPQVIAGNLGHLLTALHSISPALTARLARAAVDVLQIGRKPVAHTHGNLTQPASGLGRVAGGWRERYGRVFTWTIAALVIASTAGVALVNQDRRARQTAIRR